MSAQEFDEIVGDCSFVNELDESNYIAFDTETELFLDGNMLPALVCGSGSGPQGEILLDRDSTFAFIKKLLLDPNVIIPGANIPYDFAIIAYEDPNLLPLIFYAYDNDRIFDVLIAQALDAIAHGHLFQDPRVYIKPLRSPSTKKISNRYSLEIVTDLVLGRIDAKKNDFWRKRYAILAKVPMSEWPQDAIQYPKDDAKNTRDVALHQLKTLVNLHDMGNQTRAAWAMHLGAVWGIRTDAKAIDELDQRTEKAYAAAVEQFKDTGFFKIDKKTGDIKKNVQGIKRAVAVAYGASGIVLCSICNGTGKVKNAKGTSEIYCTEGPSACDGTGFELSLAPDLPRTDGGGISASRDTLTESGDETLEKFGKVSMLAKIRETYVPWLRGGVDKPIILQANVLKETGRATYSELMNLIPKDGGVRECFCARPGYCFCSSDYAGGELCTLAQCCLWIVGYSKMADTINLYKDPGALHTKFGATLLGIDEEDFKTLVKAKDPKAIAYRTIAKNCNFGLPGGLGPAKFVTMTRIGDIRFCKSIGGAEVCGIEKVTTWNNHPCPPICKVCVEIAARLKEQWLSQWPEVRQYFKFITNMVNTSGTAEHFVSKRIRGGLQFCDGANGYFQGLLADLFKQALYRVSKESYTDRKSPLWGTRVIAGMHDEIFSENPLETAHLSGPRISEIMIDTAKEYVPNVFMTAEPTLMLKWSKQAKTIYDNNGKLLVWNEY